MSAPAVSRTLLFYLLYFFATWARCKGPYKSSFTGWLRTVWIPEQNAQERLTLLRRQRSKRKFLRCQPALCTLVKHYFQPYEKSGITDSMVVKGFQIASTFGTDRSLTLVQVINGTIYVNDSHNKGMYGFERSRLDFILEGLHSYLDRLRTHCASRNSALCSKNFSLVIDLKDCQSGWTAGNRTDLVRQGYSRLPILTMTRCSGRHSIPVPQWYTVRDGPFEKWDEHRLTFIERVRQSPYWSRQDKAVFRGAFRPYSSHDQQGRQVPTLITDANWASVGRSRLQYLGWTRPDILDVAIKVEPGHRYIFDGYTNRLVRGHYLSTLEQAVRFRHVIYAEGWCGWADRLKTLLLFNSTIFLQQTPCREYYQDLMKAYVHYVPVDGRFRRLEDRIVWAKKHRLVAEQIASNALEMAEKYLSEDSITCYLDMVFAKYSSLFRDNIQQPHRGTLWKPEGMA